MAHEIGHHLEAHTIRPGGSNPPDELEADEFSGWVLRRLGAALQDAQAVFKTSSSTGSSTHPPRDARLAAVAAGWDRANVTGDTSCYSAPDPVRDPAPNPIRLPGPECAELPGQYLGENHAECWEEIENRPGCFFWDTHYHSDQTTKWTGRCRSGFAEGRGIYSVSAGSEHSSSEGTGMMVDGFAIGPWVENWSDGTRFEGEYRDGKRTGRGTYTWANGSRYEGEWRDDDLNGFGTMTYASSSRYEGEWRDDERNGFGTMTYASGSRYEGEWRDGEQHGFGTMTYASGSRYEGEWRDGEQHVGTMTYASGNRYEGEWRDYERNGRGDLHLGQRRPLRGRV